MRRLLVLATALVVALACTAAAQPAVTFVFKGRGWGHGLGLAQYGAHGFALRDGQSHGWILRHYYDGAKLGTAKTRTVRVLLAEGRAQLEIGSASSFKVTDGRGRTFTLAAGTHVLKTDLKVETASGRKRTLDPPAKFKPAGSHLRLSGNPYRGRIHVRLRGARLDARNRLGLEPYLKGVVAWEMPASWHMQALKAQAVVARTYALVSRKTGLWFDLYPDTRSQVYGGVRAEASRTSKAVDETAGKVVLVGGELAWTFYHSTSGGRTASIADEWNSEPRSYLVPVADPHDDLSPHHRWGPGDPEDDCPGSGADCVWTAGQLRDRLGSAAPSGLRDITVTRNASKRVASAHLRGSGGSTTPTGGELRSGLGLRSTWFTVGVLRLTGGGTIERGDRRTLGLLVRNLSGVELQRRPAGGGWITVRDVPKGKSTYAARPRVTTEFRLTAPLGVATKPVRVRVEP